MRCSTKHNLKGGAARPALDDLSEGIHQSSLQPPRFQDELLTEDNLKDRWKLASAKKLQADRVKGIGCPFVRIGRCVRYRLSDVVAYELANRRQSTGEG
ncbi:hypothetical protein [Azospirillum largimobile]